MPIQSLCVLWAQSRLIILSLGHPEADPAGMQHHTKKTTSHLILVCVAGLRAVHQALPPVTIIKSQSVAKNQGMLSSLVSGLHLCGLLTH